MTQETALEMAENLRRDNECALDTLGPYGDEVADHLLDIIAALRARAEKAEAARDFLLARISEVKRDLEIGDRQDSNWDHVRAAILKCGLHDVDAREALAGKGE